MDQNAHYNPQSEQPVTVQPGTEGDQPWMQPPQTPVGCPPGLEYLTLIDQVLCHQIASLVEAFVGLESDNKYSIKNCMGQQIYYVFEHRLRDCVFFCYSNSREFTLRIVDNFNQEVMRIHRPMKTCAGCCWLAGFCRYCTQEVQVEAPPGVVIGRVKQKHSNCNYNFEIQDADGNAQLRIKGPYMTCRCCTDVEFPIYALNGTDRVGCITKQWSGLAQEVISNADNFGVSFPMNLGVKTKATLLGAMFLIDFMIFEQYKGEDECGGLLNTRMSLMKPLFKLCWCCCKCMCCCLHLCKDCDLD